LEFRRVLFRSPGSAGRTAPDRPAGRRRSRPTQRGLGPTAAGRPANPTGARGRAAGTGAAPTTEQHRVRHRPLFPAVDHGPPSGDPALPPRRPTLWPTRLLVGGARQPPRRLALGPAGGPPELA